MEMAIPGRLTAREDDAGMRDGIAPTGELYIRMRRLLAETRAIAAPGEIIHEVGTTCMGADPKTSVVNQWCQSWGVKNLFVTDGGPFASHADKNPALSILALAWRATDYIVDQAKKGAL